MPVSGPSLTKYLREIKRGMAYFGSVSEISVHGRLAVGRWDMEGREWQDKATLLVSARKRERERWKALETRSTLQRHGPKWPTSANTAPSPNILSATSLSVYQSTDEH